MSNEEHYFENLLFSYAGGGAEQYDICKENDINTQYFSQETKRAIEICASYIIDCCKWEQDVLDDFLKGNFKCGNINTSDL